MRTICKWWRQWWWWWGHFKMWRQMVSIMITNMTVTWGVKDESGDKGEIVRPLLFVIIALIQWKQWWQAISAMLIQWKLLAAPVIIKAHSNISGAHYDAILHTVPPMGHDCDVTMADSQYGCQKWYTECVTFWRKPARKLCKRSAAQYPATMKFSALTSVELVSTVW